jgi:hypothetical protein
MNYISSFIPSSSIGKWLFGASLVPAELLLREVCLKAVKPLQFCSETQVEYFQRNFQKIEYRQPFFLLKRASSVQRLAVEKLVNFVQNGTVAFLEEGLFRLGLQYYVLSYIPSCVYGAEAEISEEAQLLGTILRIATTAALFGLMHSRSAEIRNEEQLMQGQVSLDEVEKERNFQVIGACVSGLVYGSAYELTQSFWAAHGSHTMWNFVHDLITVNSLKEPAKIEQKPTSLKMKNQTTLSSRVNKRR